MKNKVIFPIKEGDKEIKLCVVRPERKVQDEAQKEYNKAFRNAIESKAILRAKVLDVMRDQNLWNDEKQNEFNKLQKSLRQKELTLKAGGMKLSEGKEVALQLISERRALRDLISERSSLDANTAEAQAENARFNYLLSRCLLTEDGKSYYETFDEYLEKSNDLPALEGAKHLAAMLYDTDLDFEHKLPENTFLKKYKFIDAKLRFVDRQGRLTTADGKHLVDEDGRFRDENGNYVDIDGNKVDAEGDLLIEDAQPFYDDDGNPVE